MQTTMTEATTPHKTMSKAAVCVSVFFFTGLIIASNYFVQFPINSFLTLGAITYPFTFLLSDIISERYSKQDALKVVRIGIICAFIPSFFLAEPQIAMASVLAFFVSQQADIHIFYWIKSHFSKIWWLRSAGSTAFSQFIDTMIFFHIAFLGVMPWQSVLMLMIGDYSLKLIFAFLNTPWFYLFGIKMQKFLGVLRY